MKPLAKSLILDLLSTLRSGSMSVRALIEAGAVFDLRENGIRVALARLLADGLVDRDERGFYRLGASAASPHKALSSWRRVEDRTRAWQGQWLATIDRTGPGVLRPREARRRFESNGLRELEPGIRVRPDNLVGAVEGLRERLAATGLGSTAILVVRMDALDPESERRARSLWDANELGRGYRESIQRLETSSERLEWLDEAEGMAESFLVGGEAIRQVLADPLLPDPIAPTDERRAMLEALRRYEKLGRRCWAAFMKRYGAPTNATPMDRRLSYAEHGMSAAGGSTS